MHIIDNKIYHHAEKLGWIEGSKIKAKDEKLMGYFDAKHVYGPDMHQITYVENETLRFRNGQSSISLEKVNEAVEGAYPLPTKCAVYVFFND